MSTTKTTIEIQITGRLFRLSEQEARELQRELNRALGIPNPPVASNPFAPPVECAPSPTVAPNWGGQQPSTCCDETPDPPHTMDEAREREGSLLKSITDAINAHSAENGSDTPDFILAGYLIQSLAAFDNAVWERKRWYAEPEEP